VGRSDDRVLQSAVVPINVNYRYLTTELAYLFQDAGLRGVIFERSFEPLVVAAAQDAPDLDLFVVLEDRIEHTAARNGALQATPYEVALAQASPDRDFPPRSSDDLYVLYTGGTTGMPKGVLWRSEDIFEAAMRVGRSPAPLSAPEDLTRHLTQPGAAALLLAPLMHGAAQWSMWSRLTTGDTVVLWTGKSFDADAILRTAAAQRATSIALVGDAMARPLAEAHAAAPDHYDLSALRAIISGGALLSQSVRDQLNAALPGVRIFDTFGASETGYNGSGTAEARFSLGSTTTVLDDDLSARSNRAPARWDSSLDVATSRSATTMIRTGRRRPSAPGQTARVGRSRATSPRSRSTERSRCSGAAARS